MMKFIIMFLSILNYRFAFADFQELTIVSARAGVNEVVYTVKEKADEYFYISFYANSHKQEALKIKLAQAAILQRKLWIEVRERKYEKRCHGAIEANAVDSRGRDICVMKEIVAAAGDL